MSDDIKPAMLTEGQSQGQRANDNQESLSLDTDSIEGVTGSTEDTPDGNPVRDIRKEDVEGGHTHTPSPDIEADAGADPQAPNRKGEG